MGRLQGWDEPQQHQMHQQPCPSGMVLVLACCSSFAASIHDVTLFAGDPGRLTHMQLVWHESRKRMPPNVVGLKGVFIQSWYAPTLRPVGG